MKFEVVTTASFVYKIIMIEVFFFWSYGHRPRIRSLEESNLLISFESKKFEAEKIMDKIFDSDNNTFSGSPVWDCFAKKT